MTQVRTLCGVVWAVLREIFDEAAFARFLGRNCLAASAESYAMFLRENETVKARRPRCC